MYTGPLEKSQLTEQEKVVMNYEIAYVFTITLLITKIPKKYGTEKTQIITLNSQIAV